MQIPLPLEKGLSQELLVSPLCLLGVKGEDLAWFSVLGPDANMESRLVDRFSSRVSQPPALLPALCSHIIDFTSVSEFKQQHPCASPLNALLSLCELALPSCLIYSPGNRHRPHSNDSRIWLSCLDFRQVQGLICSSNMLSPPERPSEIPI